LCCGDGFIPHSPVCDHREAVWSSRRLVIRFAGQQLAGRIATAVGVRLMGPLVVNRVKQISPRAMRLRC
jgi:hypothetical protein